MKIRTLLALASAVAFATGVHAADAAAAWDTHCSSCHGSDGKGETKMGKKLKIRDLTDAAYQAGFTDEDIFNAVRIGVKNESGKTTMKAIPEVTDDELNALVTFVRGLKK